jgi:Tat protein secretion system quality control protein TatD with DNase activity
MCTSNELTVEDPLDNDPLVDEFKDEWYPLLCDAHCHAHDDTQRLDGISTLRTGQITLMGVRLDDWDTVVKVAGESHGIVPCFGIHPWYTYRLLDDDKDSAHHYQHVLTGPDDQEKQQLISELPPPILFSTWFGQLEQHLRQHPSALVGEVGLDRSARLLPSGAIEWHGVKPTRVSCTIDHQCKILEHQLRLAIDLNRAVSLHCVQSQGHLLTLLHTLNNNGKPGRICLHSFGGKPASLAQFLKLRHLQVYVSFSVAINARLGWAKLGELIRTVPDDRLLIESDLNSPKDLDLAMVRMACLVSRAKQWSLHDAILNTRRNWLTFTGRSES